MPFPYDDDFYEDSGTFNPDERPTVAEGRKKKRRQEANDPDYRLGKLIVEVITQRHEIDRLNRMMFSPQKSIRPQVQTAGLSAGAAAIVVTIYEIVKLLGILPK